MNQMPKPEIGNIVYLLNSDTNSLMPALVVEEITSRSIHGTECRHIVDPGNGRLFKLEETGKTYFLNLQSAREFLMSAASNIIDVAISRAEKSAESMKIKTSDVSTDNNENIRVDLGNGQSARVRINLPQEAL